jgi:hypothetical protein
VRPIDSTRLPNATSASSTASAWASGSTSAHQQRCSGELPNMAMIRFDPVRELLTLQDRMNRLFDGNTTEDTLSMRGSWVPPVDIYETDGHDLVISAELPDMATRSRSTTPA